MCTGARRSIRAPGVGLSTLVNTGLHRAADAVTECYKHILERDLMPASSRKAGKDMVQETALSQLLAARARVKVKEWQTVRPEDMNISVCPQECRGT